MQGGGRVYRMQPSSRAVPVLKGRSFYAHYMVQKINRKGKVLGAQRVLVVGHLLIFQVDTKNGDVSNIIPVEKLSGVRFQQTSSQLLITTSDPTLPDSHVILVPNSANMPPQMPPAQMPDVIKFAYAQVTRQDLPVSMLRGGEDILHGARKAKPPGHLSSAALLDSWKKAPGSPTSPFRPASLQSVRLGQRDVTVVNVNKGAPNVPAGLPLDEQCRISQNIPQGRPFATAGGAVLRGCYVTKIDGTKVRTFEEARTQMEGKASFALTIAKEPLGPPTPPPVVKEPTPEVEPLVLPKTPPPEIVLPPQPPPAVELPPPAPAVTMRDVELQVGGGDLYEAMQQWEEDTPASVPAAAPQMLAQQGVAQDILAHTLARDLVAHNMSLHNSARPEFLPPQRLLGGPASPKSVQLQLRILPSAPAVPVPHRSPKAIHYNTQSQSPTPTASPIHGQATRAEDPVFEHQRWEGVGGTSPFGVRGMQGNGAGLWGGGGVMDVAAKGLRPQFLSGPLSSSGFGSMNSVASPPAPPVFPQYTNRLVVS